MLICFSGIVHGEITQAFLHQVPKLMMIPSIRLVDCQRCFGFSSPNVRVIFLRGSPRPAWSSVYRARLNTQVNAEPLTPAQGSFEQEVFGLCVSRTLLMLPICASSSRTAS